jgi:5-methylcytosine-specific restriction endonuclease McrA
MAICPEPGCAEIVSKKSPCPKHGRPLNAPWSKNRSPAERAAQARMRKQALARDNFTCQRCGHHDSTGKTLDVHHTRGAHTYALEFAETLCNSKANGCHRARDPWAR